MKTVSLVLAATLFTACAGQQAPEEPITWSAEWFQCDNRFQCVAIYDAYCKYTAVNSNYMLVYQDWARQQVAGLEDLKACPPLERDFPGAAYCRENRCVN